jgi:hypothetical protein
MELTREVYAGPFLRQLLVSPGSTDLHSARIIMIHVLIAVFINNYYDIELLNISN